MIRMAIDCPTCGGVITLRGQINLGPSPTDRVIDVRPDEWSLRRHSPRLLGPSGGGEPTAEVA